MTYVINHILTKESPTLNVECRMSSLTQNQAYLKDLTKQIL
jgi:hypothetical protein